MIDYFVKSRSMREIRNVVNFIKKEFGFYNNLKFPVIDFFEKILPEIFEDYRFIYVEDDELEGMEAYTDHYSKLVKIKISVYENALKGKSKDLFTIAHEIGHLFLHDEEARIFARTNERFSSYKSAEWQANYFAAELLMGSHLILDMSIEEIVKACNVSKKSALIQLKHAKEEREKGLL